MLLVKLKFVISDLQHYYFQLIVNEDVHVSPPPLHSFKLHGDNIDKEVRPSHMRKNRQTKSLHVFNVFAVRDRIDSTMLPETHEIPQSLSYQDFIPTDGDYNSLKNNFKILVQRIICQHMSFFKEHFLNVVTAHIAHKYSEEMKQKSEIVRKIMITINVS